MFCIVLLYCIVLFCIVLYYIEESSGQGITHRFLPRKEYVKKGKRGNKI